MAVYRDACQPLNILSHIQHHQAYCHRSLSTNSVSFVEWDANAKCVYAVHQATLQVWLRSVSVVPAG